MANLYQNRFKLTVTRPITNSSPFPSMMDIPSEENQMFLDVQNIVESIDEGTSYCKKFRNDLVDDFFYLSNDLSKLSTLRDNLLSANTAYPNVNQWWNTNQITISVGSMESQGSYENPFQNLPWPNLDIGNPANIAKIEQNNAYIESIKYYD